MTLRQSGTMSVRVALVVALVVAASLAVVQASQDVMKNLAINFAKPLDDCRKEVST